ncbi:hypothetical protein VPH35_057820 [Triticum aestivum]
MASGGRGGSWPTSLSTPETDELLHLGMMVPPGCSLSHVFRITADGYPTRGPGASPDEHRRHEGGRWNIARRESRTGGSSSGPRGSSSAPRWPRCPPPAAAPSPSSSRRPVPALARPASPPVVEIPPEQFALREDGDPDDCPGYLIALRASQAEAAAAEAREAAELQAALDAAAAAAEAQAALDAAAAIEAVQPQVAPEEGDDGGGYWDDDGKSSDDGDSDDNGDVGAGEIIDLAASDDDE